MIQNGKLYPVSADNVQHQQLVVISARCPNEQNMGYRPGPIDALQVCAATNPSCVFCVRIGMFRGMDWL